MQSQTPVLYHEASLNQPAHYISNTGTETSYRLKTSYYQRPTQFFDEFAYRPVPSTSTSVAIHTNSRQFNPNLGSNEFYSDVTPVKGLRIVRSLNNIFIPQLAP